MTGAEDKGDGRREAKVKAGPVEATVKTLAKEGLEQRSDMIDPVYWGSWNSAQRVEIAQ